MKKTVAGVDAFPEDPKGQSEDIANNTTLSHPEISSALGKYETETLNLSYHLLSDSE